MITLFIPYFGTFPNYFQAYLDSLAVNQDVLTVVLVTDIDTSSYVLPPNLRKITMSLQDIRHRISKLLRNVFGKSPSVETLVPTPYKLVDFKVTYPLLFDDLYDSSVDDFVGWGDIDLIYGKLNQFVVGNYDIIGGWHGHFTAIKNTILFKNLFMSVPKFYDLCTDGSKTYITDEIAFRQPLVDFIKTHDLKMCYINASFCDIVPPCFYNQFRPEAPKMAKNFFNVAKPRVNISYLSRDESGSLKTIYDSGEIQETSYVHLQKRAMSWSPVGKTYFITDNAFVLDEPVQPLVIPNNLFMTWHTKNLEPSVQANVDKIIRMNPDIKMQLYDLSACVEFIGANFPPEVLAAYNALKPIAYKADLWRLCILYIYGGIYMDISLVPNDNFFLKTLLTREHFTSDGIFYEDDKKYTSICNGLISCKPGNKILLKAIVTIVVNVSRRFYGRSEYAVSGPQCLGPIYDAAYDKEPLYIKHVGPKGSQTIHHNGAIVMTIMKKSNYSNKLPHYSDMWKNKDIYTDDVITIDSTGWPADMKILLAEINASKKIRLHLPAIPYTITRDEFSHDAYTGKVQRFSPMMRSLKVDGEPVFEVFHYGTETSESGADHDITLLTKEEWHSLRIDSMQFLDKKLTRAEAEAKVLDPKMVVSVLANWSTPLFKEFNRRFRKALTQNYRDRTTDIVCVPLGRSYDDALTGFNATVIETGIGYGSSCKPYRIFESYCWMSKTLGEEKVSPNNYWFVIPNFYNIEDFKFTEVPSTLRPRVGFLGRVIAEKGGFVIAEIAKRFPNVDFVLCGQGNADPFLKSANISYKMPIHGSERSDFLGSCIATICASTYLEPFGGSGVESQICGTPVIAIDNGAFVETVEQFKTGLRCHTLADFCKGIQMALDGVFDRKYVRQRAIRLYDMYKLAKDYEYVFKSVLDIQKPEKNGWFSQDCHMKTLIKDGLTSSVPL